MGGRFVPKLGSKSRRKPEFQGRGEERVDMSREAIGELETGMSKNEYTCVNTVLAYALGGKQVSTNVNKMNSIESPFIQKRDDNIVQEVGDYAKTHTTTLTQ
ncbi:Elongation factor 1-alpha 1 [Microtus ochrogaster]|uniref:Elongation factor 1-alpha 1 n=1 Tax=Microtus ochrogaster TaxID=79684 RepID=A0A8J6GJ16_MICOH|nr:Elongation factor 1-alpha 1 [Microtus ochrogaster]